MEQNYTKLAGLLVMTRLWWRWNLFWWRTHTQRWRTCCSWFYPT